MSYNYISSSLICTSISSHIIIKTEDDDNYELFNRLKAVPDIPLICVDDYFKYLKEFNILNINLDSWKTLINTNIREKNLNLKLNRSITNIPNYCDVIIYPNKEDDNYMNVEIEINLERENLNVNVTKDLIPQISLTTASRLMDNLKKEFNQSDTLIKGHYYISIPKKNSNNKSFDKKSSNKSSKKSFENESFFTKFLFCEFLLNNEIVNKQFILDEHYDAKKSDNLISIIVETSNKKYIFLDIEQNVINRNDLNIILLDHERFSINTVYLKITVSNYITNNQFDELKVSIDTLLRLYKENEIKTMNKIAEYINTVEIDKRLINNEFQKKIVKKNNPQAKDLDPIIFRSGYPRLCPKAPRIDTNLSYTEIDYVDWKNMSNSGKMRFPKEPITINNIKIIPKIYSCKHHKAYPHPGLKVNDTESKDITSVVPCCYKNEHFTRKNTLWHKYYVQNIDLDNLLNDDDEYTEVSSKYTATTNKILKKGFIGNLPKDIDNFFSLYDSNFFREGSSDKDSQSIIDTLLYATNNRKTSVTEVLEALIENIILNHNIISQECYDYTQESIICYLKDFSRYFDFRLFIRLLEHYFECNIFVFEKTETNPNGILSGPRYSSFFIQEENILNVYKNNIIIYENNKNLSCRCELIVRKNKDGKFQYVFGNDENIIKQIKKTYIQMYVSTIVEIPNFKTPIKGEYTDYYGKTRYIYFAYDTHDIWLVTDPLPCLYKKNDETRNNIKIIPFPVVISIEKQLAEKFLQKEEITQYDINKDSTGYIIGYSFSINNIKFYLPIIPHMQNENNASINSNTDFFYPTGKQESIINIYNNYDKIARYSKEYLLFLFSLFAKDIPTIHDFSVFQEHIYVFVDIYIEVDLQFQLPHINSITRKFDIDNCPLIRNKKLIVQNPTVLRNLIFSLKIKWRDNKQEILDYYKNKYLQNFYVEPIDFIQNDKEYILKGVEAFNEIFST